MSSSSSSNSLVPGTEVQAASVSKGGSTFQTAEGTIRVQPFKPKGSKGLKALVSFQPRSSHFDLGNPASSSNPFRGFYTLFWIGLFLLAARTIVEYYTRTGYPLQSTFFTLITGDALALALSDAVLVGSSFGAWAFAKGMQKGWWGYGWKVIAVQHLFQALYLGTTVHWTFQRNWYWVQSGFLVLHAMSMLMKIQSYIAHNGYLCNIHQVKVEAEKQLDGLLAQYPSGRDAALAEATQVQQEAEEAKRKLEQEEEARLAALSGGGLSEVSTPGSEILQEQAVPKTVALSEAVLRQRLNAVPTLPPTTVDAPAPTATSNSKMRPPPAPAATHPLTFHPSYDISTLAKNIDVYKAELTSTGVKQVVWPNNVSLWNFCDYLLVPTLVYELEWPRTNKMRPIYVFEKVCATIGTFSLIVIITENYIMPMLPKEGDSFVVTFINLALPMVIDYLLVFIIIFESICNGFAELTYFADREFYEDWWNSTSWDQFARQWNKPVHTFLLRHVYSSSLSTGKVSRNQATFLTFLLSACCHELVMVVVSKKLRFYLFVLQMAQLPLIAVGRLPIFKRNPLAGNIVFWLGLLSGFPLLAIGYLMY